MPFVLRWSVLDARGLDGSHYGLFVLPFVDWQLLGTKKMLRYALGYFRSTIPLSVPVRSHFIQNEGPGAMMHYIFVDNVGAVVPSLIFDGFSVQTVPFFSDLLPLVERFIVILGPWSVVMVRSKKTVFSDPFCWICRALSLRPMTNSGPFFRDNNLLYCCKADRTASKRKQGDYPRTIASNAEDEVKRTSLSWSFCKDSGGSLGFYQLFVGDP